LPEVFCVPSCVGQGVFTEVMDEMRIVT